MSFARGLSVQTDVVLALVLRETRTRFGKNYLGYLWALLEPLLIITTFYLVFRFASREPSAGMDVYSFICTGFLPFLMFRSTATQVASAISGNRALLFYPHVQPLDIAFARGVLEAGTHVALFAILMGAHALYHQQLVVEDYLLVVQGLAFAGFLGFAFGLVLCSIGVVSSAIDRARGPMIRPIFWTSGIFFTADELPGVARDALLYNPLLHATELVRGGWFLDYSARHAEPLYVVQWVFMLGLTGLVLERVVRRRIEV